MTDWPIDKQKRRQIHEMFISLPGYPWLPCPICHFNESCDHTRFERAHAAIPDLVIPDQSKRQS